MKVLRICAIYLFVFCDNSRVHYRYQQGLSILQVGASVDGDYQRDATTSNYLSLPDTTSEPVSELGKYDQVYNSILTVVQHPIDNPDIKDSEILPSVEIVSSDSKVTVRGFNYKKCYTFEALGIKSSLIIDSIYTCDRINKSNENYWPQSTRKKRLLTSSEASEKLTEARMDKDIPEAAQESDSEREQTYTELCTGCSLVATTSSSQVQEETIKKSSLAKVRRIIKSISTKKSINLSTKSILNSNTSYTSSTVINVISTALTKSHLNFSISSEKPQHYIHSFANKKRLIFGSEYRKDSKKYTHNTTFLKMILKSENATIFYPGNYDDSPFHGHDRIILSDTAFSNMLVWFSLQLVDDNGNAYSQGIGNAAKCQSLQCMVQGVSDEVIYSGWHRWEHDPSKGTSLKCDTGPVSFSIEENTITEYPLWLDWKNGDQKFKGLIDLQPSISGLYICIVVDSKYNVVVTNYQDIRIVKVVTSLNSSIIPQQVIIYENDTRASFIYNNCKGQSSPQSTAIVFSGCLVGVLYLDNNTRNNESFTVSYLQDETWIKVKPMFENIDLSKPMLVRCQLLFRTVQRADTKYTYMYFRHDYTKHRREKVFTAVANETLSFSCSDLRSTVIPSANACYFDGNCSDNKSTYTCNDGANLTLTIHKQMCFVCSSDFNEIKLQINIEDDLRINVTKETDQKGQIDCSVLLHTHKDLSTVKRSNYCEENAISLINGMQYYQNKTKTFKSFTYMAFYTSRQFIVCQNQSVVWSIVNSKAHALNPSTNDGTIVLKITACSFTGITLLLIILAWKRRCQRVQHEQTQELRLGNIPTSYLRELSSNSLLERDELSAGLDFVHSKENFQRSRISLGNMIGNGKFGNVYQATIKSLKVCENVLEAAVKELKKQVDKSDNISDRITGEIKIMRMIVSHMNIIRYYGFSFSSESNLLIMELVKGPCLLEYLREQRTRVPGFVIKMSYITESMDTEQACLNCKMCDSVLMNISDSRRYFLSNNDIENSECDRDRNDVNVNVDSDQFANSLSDATEPAHDQWSIESDHTHRKNCYTDDIYYTCEIGYRRAVESLTKEIFSICRQVARGMFHIASLNIIHCDLAARNILVEKTASTLVVKICDFGMAQHLPEGETVYKGDSKGPRPFRWMSPEALNKREFSVFSDVWSYGVLCWEVVTLGSTPFGKMPTLATAAKVASGQHLPRPSNCDAEVFAILKSCWKLKPDERPSFKNLEEKWSDILEAISDYLEIISDEDG